jgi:adenosylcobyric acid synthase
MEDEGCRAGSVVGFSWHGALEHDDFRRALLGWVASIHGRDFVPGTTPFAAARAARLDALGDLVANHVDTARLAPLIENGPPPDLPTLTTEVRECSVS